MSNPSLKPFVRGTYDVQKMRIQTGNRIVGNFKAKMGQAPGETEDTMDAEGKVILAKIRQEYARVTEGIVGLPRESAFKGNEVISDYTELCLIAQYMELEQYEKTHFNRLEKALRQYPVYTEFLKGVKGVGPAMAGVIVSEIDISKAKYPSSLWKYCGLDVGDDGAGRSRRKEHQQETEYVNKDGEVATKNGITFNPFLKTKLTGVLASSFLRAGDNKYSRIYNDYKHRLESDDKHKEKSKGHRHNMAMRYMVKMFLLDLHIAWRTVDGLSVSTSYHEGKLGHKHAA